MPENWLEGRFGEEYLALHEHRDHHEARERVALIAKRMEDVVDAPVLDRACGAGARPSGLFVLDYLHAIQVREPLVGRAEHTAGTVTVGQERELSSDGRFVRKTITIGDLGRTFVERVRLFRPSELPAPCTSAGPVVESALGDYDCSALRDDSPHTILFARRR